MRVAGCGGVGIEVGLSPGCQAVEEGAIKDSKKKSKKESTKRRAVRLLRSELPKILKRQRPSVFLYKVTM
jgi:adenine-specific DNA glycosylase